MLVIVEHRDVQLCFQPFFDLKTAGRGDVLQIDAAKARSNIFHHADDLLCILRIQTDRDRIHAAEFLEQAGLSFHDGHGRIGADIAQTQNGAAVRDNGNGVALHRIFIHSFGMLGDDPAGLCNTGGVGHGQILPVF